MIVSTQKVESVGNPELAIGLRVPNTVKDPLNYLHDAKEYDKTDNNIKKQMELCNLLYRYEGIIGNAVDILVEFAVTDTWAEPTGDKKLDKILKYFNENINDNSNATMSGVYHLMEKFFLEYIVNGNVFPYNYWENVKIPDVGEVAMPRSITMLNPQYIRIPEESLAFGQEMIYFQPDLNIINAIRSDGRSNPESMYIKKALPPSIVRKIKNGSGGGFGDILLDPRYVKHIKRKAKDYRAWGTPLLTRTFSAVAIIKKLRKLDEATIEGLVNLLTIFKVGTDEFPAGPDRLSELRSVLTDAKASTMLVWPHDIDVLQTGPDGKVLSFKDKYTEAYSELKRALGVVPGLLGEDAKVDYEDLLAMIERLETIRTIGKKWLSGIYRQIANENNKKEYPKSKMARMNLYDADSIKNHVVNFYDRGLIDPKTALTEAGYNYEAIIASKKEVKPLVKKGEFEPPVLPFSAQDTRTGQRPDPDDKEIEVEQDVNLKNKKKDKEK